MAEDVKELGMIESPPLLDGRNMVMVLGPTKNAGASVPGGENAKDEDEQRRLFLHCRKEVEHLRCRCAVPHIFATGELPPRLGAFIDIGFEIARDVAPYH